MKETCGNCKHDGTDGSTNPYCIECMKGGDGWQSDRGTEADQAADAHMARAKAKKEDRG
jgi:hypothetical protein